MRAATHGFESRLAFYIVFLAVGVNWSLACNAGCLHVVWARFVAMIFPLSSKWLLFRCVGLFCADLVFNRKFARKFCRFSFQS